MEAYIVIPPNYHIFELVKYDGIVARVVIEKREIEGLSEIQIAQLHQERSLEAHKRINKPLMELV